MLGFLAVFVTAGVARAVSTHYLARLDDMPSHTLACAGISRPLVFGAGNQNFRTFLAFSGLMHLAVFTAAPDFVLYLLRDLQLGYLQYSCWGAAPIMVQFLTLQSWGRIGDTFGNSRLVVVTGLVIPVVPMLYLLGTDIRWLVETHFLAGATCAGFGRGLQNMVFDMLSAWERAKDIAIFNTVNAGASSVGAMLGSYLVLVTPAASVLGGVTWPFVSNLPLVFFISGCLRGLTSLMLLHRLEESRAVTTIATAALIRELPLIRCVVQLRQRWRTGLVRVPVASFALRRPFRTRRIGCQNPAPSSVGRHWG